MTQLVNIAEHGHPLRDAIFTRLFADFIPKAPKAVLDNLIAKVTSGQTSNKDAMPFYLADFALRDRSDVLSQLL